MIVTGMSVHGGEGAYVMLCYAVLCYAMLCYRVPGRSSARQVLRF